MTAIRTLSIAAFAITLLPLATVDRSQAATITLSIDVPGSTDPWLAGMPDGTTASSSPISSGISVAPKQSPVLVSNLPLTAGSALTFAVVSGSVNYKSVTPQNTPDGDLTIASHTAGAQNGISNVSAPRNSLMGIFLDDQQPHISAPPPALNFATPASRNYVELSPLLKQVFFIGDGLNNQGVFQQIIVPKGTDRFYLGTMDAYDWSDNVGAFGVALIGAFGVQVTVDVPPPQSLVAEVSAPDTRKSEPVASPLVAEVAASDTRKSEPVTPPLVGEAPVPEATIPEFVAVPEPTTLIGSFLGLGILGAAAPRRCRQKQKSFR
ncbi:MAG: PEP-CTERM sorting domain-containing protein [Microcoleus sp. SU_5_3]|nr:PEP-CTERM sorting domain-containing protein [Microcoleus sp. SU_5_3]